MWNGLISCVFFFLEPDEDFLKLSLYHLSGGNYNESSCCIHAWEVKLLGYLMLRKEGTQWFISCITLLCLSILIILVLVHFVLSVILFWMVWQYNFWPIYTSSNYARTDQTHLCSNLRCFPGTWYPSSTPHSECSLNYITGQNETYLVVLILSNRDHSKFPMNLLKIIIMLDPRYLNWICNFLNAWSTSFYFRRSMVKMNNLLHLVNKLGLCYESDTQLFAYSMISQWF